MSNVYIQMKWTIVMRSEECLVLVSFPTNWAAFLCFVTFLLPLACFALYIKKFRQIHLMFVTFLDCFPPLPAFAFVANASDHLFSFAISTTTVDKWYCAGIILFSQTIQWGLWTPVSIEHPLIKRIQKQYSSSANVFVKYNKIVMKWSYFSFLCSSCAKVYPC